jgi:hypothetical protein
LTTIVAVREFIEFPAACGEEGMESVEVVDVEAETAESLRHHSSSCELLVERCKSK